MFAKATIVQFKPDMLEQARRFVSEVVLPRASTHAGFQGAFFLQQEENTEQCIIVSLWETKEDMQASRPPAELLPQMEAFDQSITTVQQDIYEVILKIEKP